MSVARVNARLSGPLASFVERMIGEDGLYETPSEYIRDLIRRDMERRGSESDIQRLFETKLLGAYDDIATGRVFASTGNFKADMAILDRKDAEGWR